MIDQPPNWKSYITPNFFQQALDSIELQELVKKAEREYVYWDKFKYYPPPKGFSIKEAWAFLKFSRTTNREKTPIVDNEQNNFTYTVTKTMYQKLSYIDSNTSGFIINEWNKPTDAQKNQLIVSSLSEEAIASSQIEGANTSRKAAKQMILSQRKPRTRDEKMIINNYMVMQKLMEWKNLELSNDMLLEIQSIITKDTLENSKDEGRFRSDEDGVQVVDRLTGIVAFTPPRFSIYKEQLNELIKFANADEKEEDFIHPVIKSTIIHFWLAYLHPFVDGNGRTARALFYWYLLRKNYWLFQYLSVSRVIRMSRVQYDNAFLKTELDDNDLTYFLIYNLKTINKAIDDFIEHFKNKLSEEKRIEQMAVQFKGLNERQLLLINYLIENPQISVDIKTHKNKYQTAYQTARTDLIKLHNKGMLTQISDGKKYIYVPNKDALRKYLKLNLHVSGW